MSLAPAAERPANWVRGWGRCEVCDGLTRDTVCGEACQDLIAERYWANPTPPPAISIAERATVRPTYVLMLSEHEPDEFSNRMHLATWRIPDRASKNAKLVAKAVTVILNERLAAGWSLSYVFRSGAPGRDQIVRTLKSMGEKRDRKTVPAGLEELRELGFMDKVGQLPDWVDPSEPTAAKVNKTGAFLYSVAFSLRELGQLALDALVRTAGLGDITPTDRVNRA